MTKSGGLTFCRQSLLPMHTPVGIYGSESVFEDLKMGYVERVLCAESVVTSF